MFRFTSRRLLSSSQRFIRCEGKSALLTREDSRKASQRTAAVLYLTFAAITAGTFGMINYAENSGVDIKKVKAEIVEAIEKDDELRGDGTSVGPTLVRLAWHASGTYSIFDKTGGSNFATMRFEPEANWGANAGLKIARDFLEPIRIKYNMSHGDIWTLAGATAVESMGGPVIPWHAGRTDATDETTQKILPNGRLPQANLGCPHATNAHIRDIFGRMGFTDRETVALIGAHVIGRCHPEASGYWGPWTNAETTFSNQYFVLLSQESWVPKTVHEGKEWQGPLQYESSRDAQIMMLPADLWLLQDPQFKMIVDEYAANEELFFQEFANAFNKLLTLGVPSFP